ncbi:lipoxygenase homology domain-containing protein 1 isoform X2 [Argonauta hians]
MWLATDEGDGLINRILHEESTLKKTLEKQQSWFVWVCTSERVRARTNAKVSIVVYGRKGKSEELLLNNGKNTFEAGQTDKFEIVTKDIGTPYKIRIWHDNSGATPGWHLHKIEMENSETGKHYEFQANCWLSKDEVEGGQIVRELPVSGPQVKDQLTVVQYVVTVYTGDVLGAGTDAKVFVNLFGKLGDTGKRYLENSKNNRNKFERGKVDEFIIEAVDLKEISKVCIGHDASRPGSGWFLDRVEISGNNNPSKVDLFPCNRWLAIDEDDGLTVRELTKGESQLLNTTTYEVHVKTGNIRGAGTDANVFLQILGSKNDTEEIPLKTPENSTDPFERGRIDIFKLELRNIGEIKKIKIGHDNSQLGAGWFLDTVLIKIPSQGKKYWFDCFRWLAVDEDDGQTQVILEASTLEQRDKVDPYEVTLWTGDVPNAGTNSNIHIKLYGDQGKSEECTLTNKSDNFKQGSVNTFKIEIPEIGELQKILVRCDNKGLFAGWFLHKILITRPRIVKTVSCGKTERQGTSNKHQPYSSDSQVEQYWFIVNQWFDKDANSSTKELVPTDQNGKPLQKYLQEIEYTVKVVTGDVFGAGTDANVFITVYGEYGDTSERSLAKSKNLNKFERNQEDIFVVKAIDMGRLRKVKIWHDNSGSNAAWFLDYVEVIDIKNQLTFFPCQRWLATNEGDGQVVRELIPVNVSLKKKLLKNNCEALKEEIGLEVKALTTTYHVKVFTADKWGAGTDANVYVILYGHLDNSGKILLKSSVCNSNKFERNQVDEFIIEVVDIGELQKIKIGHDDAGLGSAWCLDKVIIDCPSLGKSWNFPCDRWLAKNKDDGLLDKELYPKPVSTEYIPYIPYEVTTYTGDVSQASTDADVYIALYSKDKRTQQQSLCFSKAERKQKFKRNSVDKFILEMEDVGDDIERIRIGHDGSGFGAGWYLAKVQVRKLISSGKSSKTFVFPCNQWLAEDEDDGFTEKMLLAETSIIQASTTQSEQNNSEQTSGREQFLQKLPPKYKRYTQQEILDIKEESVAIRNKTSPATAAAAESQQKQAYHVIIITSRHEEAAICDDVWFTLKGSEQTTEVFEKINNSQGKYFQSYYFWCNDWVKVEKKISQNNSVKLLLLDTTQHKTSGKKVESEVVNYVVLVFTADVKHAGTDANVFINIFGENGETGRQPLKQRFRDLFERNQKDTFTIECIDLGRLRGIFIEHDSSGFGSAWLLDRVEIINNTTQHRYIFPCNSWLDKKTGTTSMYLQPQH